MGRLYKISLIFSVILSISLLICGCAQNSPLNENEESFVRFVDVGQGDCTIIHSKGRTAVIDTGTADSGEEICSTLTRSGINTIDVLLISHLHTDHTGAIPLLTQRFEIKNLILPELVTDSEGMGDALYAINALKLSGGNTFDAEQGMNFNIGDFEITVLASYGEFDEVNNHSLFVMAEIGKFRFFFSGDAETKAEKQLLKENLILDCDVFKAGHHGSSTSNSDGLLDALTPKYAVISCGIDNSYGHPHREVIESFQKREIKALRTDTHGDITFYTDGENLSFETEY